jgi:hypothetical protein
MALRVAHGLFRLWLLLTVVWVAWVGLLLWNARPEPPPRECKGAVDISECMDRLLQAGNNPFGRNFNCYDGSTPERGLPSCRTYFATIYEEVSAQRRTHLIFAAWAVLLPPALVFLVGAALIWAFRGFRA